MVKVLMICLFVGFGSPAFADEDGLSEADAKALQETQDMLRDRSRIKQEAATNPHAKQVDENVTQVMGSDQDAAGVYGLAADVFATLVKEAKGDPQKLQQMLFEAQQNPAAFAAKFSPEQKKQLRELGSKAEANKAPLPNH